jgi:nicotinate-nucleotide adenylyltransferase
MFLSLHNWREPQRILEDASLGVFYRGDPGEEEAIEAQKKRLEALGARVELVKNPVTDISSTEIRRMLMLRCASEFLPRKAEEAIYSHGFYGAGQDLRQLSEQELEKTVVSLLKPSRVNHVLGCREAAVALARRWGADETDAARAALLHDITKAFDGPLQLTLARSYGMILDDFSVRNAKTLHALTGSWVAERIFGETKAVVSAIASHTTGKPGMNLLETIIYVADYMEPNRDFPGVEELRRCAYEDIYGALELGLNMTITHLQEQGREVSPESAQTLRWLHSEERKIL